MEMLLIKSSTTDNKTLQVKVVMELELLRLRKSRTRTFGPSDLKLLLVEQVVYCRHYQLQFLVSIVLC